MNFYREGITINKNENGNEEKNTMEKKISNKKNYVKHMLEKYLKCHIHNTICSSASYFAVVSYTNTL